MGPAWGTSRKKWTMFSGRVSSGMCPRITMRSKQWYTKASRLPNSLTNDSIGPPRRRSCLDNKIIEQRAGGIKEPRHVHAGPRLFKSSRGSKFQIYLGRLNATVQAFQSAIPRFTKKTMTSRVQGIPEMVLEEVDRELVEACRRGEREAFRALFERH